MSVRVHAKSNRHRKPCLVEPGGMDRKWVFLLGETSGARAPGGVSRGHSSVDAGRKPGGAKGRRTAETAQFGELGAVVLRAHDVVAEALNFALGTLDLWKLKSCIHMGGAGLVALDKDGDLLSRRFATREGIALERWSVEFVNRGVGRCSPLFNGPVAVADWLADEQRDAVNFIGGSCDRIMGIRGVAGAGQTTMFQELDRPLLGKLVFTLRWFWRRRSDPEFYRADTNLDSSRNGQGMLC